MACRAENGGQLCAACRAAQARYCRALRVSSGRACVIRVPVGVVGRLLREPCDGRELLVAELGPELVEAVEHRTQSGTRNG